MNCYDSLSPYTTHKEHYDYRYNGFNEIIRENYDDGTTSFTKVFTYDGNGNIETMKTYEYSTSDTIDENTLLESIEFDYISDRITQITVNGVVNDAFTYDEIGNLLTDGTNSYTWNGKELTQIETSTGTYNYLYNDQGIRTQKEKVNGEITKYYLDGNKVLVETNGTDTIYYTYNFDGSLISMNLNGTEYFYVTNLQGDIIELVAEDGTTVVSYKYDAWGNIVGTPFDISNVDLANKNPYRYRGYHYDNETSLYYCNSRYYVPEWGRWLNADDVSYLDTSSVNGLNLYAYCNNNPVMYSDPSGHFVITISMLITAAIIGAVSGGVIGAAYGGLTAVANGQDFWTGALVGGLSGAFMGAGAGIGAVFIAPVLAGASITFATASGAGFVMGTALSSGTALAIGAGVAFGTGSVGGALADISSQLLYDGKVSNWGSVGWSALQWGTINTLNAFACAGFEAFQIAGTALGYGIAEAITVTSLMNIGFGSGGFLIDVLRANAAKRRQSQLSLPSFNFAYGF